MVYISTKVCKTSDIGVKGNLFGGTMLSWLDEAGASLASYMCSTPNMITLKMDEVTFKKPVKMGHHIRIYGEVKRIGTSSITLLVEARRCDFPSRSEETVCSTYITFVKIDDDGRAVPIEASVKEMITREYLNKSESI
ncbi:MAG: hotdog domain-containing protein [Bacteroidales bacterium]|nr:hotdog domain-containing protein [Bacteroidales bacterium]